MTPLARQIVKELTLPVSRRTIDDRCGILKKMDDVHCFDVTDVLPLALSLQDQIAQGGIEEKSTFLPAPKTWIEWTQESSDFGFASGRHQGGLLLIEEEDKMVAQLFTAEAGRGKLIASDWQGQSKIDLKFEPYSKDIIESIRVVDDAWCEADGISKEKWELWKKNKAGRTETFIFACLALINTPRIIGRRTHVPHKLLERKIIDKNPSLGKYPLLAWNEIKLEVNGTPDRHSGRMQEAHLTGRKALHFCRAFIRVRLGKLEIVRSHWRGDASIGIKQSRYKVVA